VVVLRGDGDLSAVRGRLLQAAQRLLLTFDGVSQTRPYVWPLPQYKDSGAATRTWRW
jgi:hypothetical protein